MENLDQLITQLGDARKELEKLELDYHDGNSQVSAYEIIGARYGITAIEEKLMDILTDTMDINIIDKIRKAVFGYTAA